MMKNDQSFLPDESNTEEENNDLYRKRSQAFRENFEVLMKITDRQGFPNSKTINDSCIDNLAHVTFIHMAQTFPKIFFDRANVDKLYYELLKHNIERYYLHSAVFFYANFNQPCEDEKAMVEYAVHKWGLDKKPDDPNSEPPIIIKYIPCKTAK
jgi:hypothetical protein